MPARWLPSTRGLPRGFWLLWLGFIVNRAGSFVQPFLALYLVSERGMSLERAGAVVALVGAGALGAGPLGGALADRIGRRPTLAMATLLEATAMLSLGWARTSPAIGAAALAVGLFGEMYRPPSMAMVADLVAPADRTRAYGLVYWGVNLGFAIATTVAGLVAAKSFRVLFVGDALAALFFGALVVGLVGETRPAGAPQRSAPSLLEPYRHGAFVAFAAVSLLVGTMFHQIGSTLPLDMGAHGVGPRDFGLLLALNGVLVVLFQPFGTSIARAMPRRRAMALGAALTGAGFGLGALATSHPVAVYALGIVIWSSGEILMSGISPSIVADFAPQHLRGSYQGAFQLAWGGATLLAPAVGAATLQHLGPRALWGGVAVAGLLAAGGFLRVVPERASGEAGLRRPAAKREEPPAASPSPD